MSDPTKKNPTPEERPDLYDFYDGRDVPPEQAEKERTYWDGIFADRKKKSASQNDDKPA